MPDPPWIHDCGKSSYGRQDEYAVETEHDYAVEEMETDNDSLNSVRALELQQLIMRGETQINADLERAANLVSGLSPLAPMPFRNKRTLFPDCSPHTYPCCAQTVHLWCANSRTAELTVALWLLP